MPKTDILRKKSRLSRTPVSRGLAAGAGAGVPFIASGAKPSDGGSMLPPSIDRDGGDYGAGLIRGASVLSRGEALGHDFWVDDTMLAQARDAINAADDGEKSRYTHPEMSGDGLGSFLGRWKNASIDGDHVRADLHLAKSAHQSPDGDLAGYVMDLAEEDPASFGSSIVFAHDEDEEGAFAERNLCEGKFCSPEKLNTGNLVHARIKRLKGADVVDSPAANPDGLFSKSRRLAIAESFSSLASYALGLSATPPATSALGAHPDRVREFVSRFLESHNLSIVPKEAPMPDPKPEEKKAAETKPTETKPEEKQAPETPPAEKKPPETPPPAADPKPAAPAALSTAAIAAEVKRFNDAFGSQGAIWLGEGKTFDECQGLYVKALQAQNAELSNRLKQAGGGQATPLSFASAEPSEKTAEKTSARTLLEKSMGTNLARFAAGIKMPGQKK